MCLRVGSAGVTLRMSGAGGGSGDGAARERARGGGRGGEKQRRRMGEVLFEAVKEGDVDRVRALCEASQADAAYTDEAGVGSVHIAAKRGDAAMLQALVLLGADWQSPDAEGATPLHYAAGAGGSGGERAVAMLLELGVDAAVPDAAGRRALQVCLLRPQ